VQYPPQTMADEPLRIPADAFRRDVLGLHGNLEVRRIDARVVVQAPELQPDYEAMRRLCHGR
jgi:hypothetical protein